MAFRSLTSRIFATSVLATVTAVGTYGFVVNRRISLADRNSISCFDDIPDSLKQSNSVKNIVNVHNHKAMADSRFITIEIPDRLQKVTDEVLLAKFVKGYFGGRVIGPERIALQTLKLDLVHFKGERSRHKGKKQILTYHSAQENVDPSMVNLGALRRNLTLSSLRTIRRVPSQRRAVGIPERSGNPSGWH